MEYIVNKYILYKRPGCERRLEWSGYKMGECRKSRVQVYLPLTTFTTSITRKCLLHTHKINLKRSKLCFLIELILFIVVNQLYNVLVSNPIPSYFLISDMCKMTL